MVSTAALLVLIVFFFNDTATTEIYTLSLHDALPISFARGAPSPDLIPAVELGECARAVALRDGPAIFAYGPGGGYGPLREWVAERHGVDRKSTRLNSSHVAISYAVFCLKKKKKKK